MLYAEKGNKVIRINEGDEQRFSSQGYTIKNGEGTVVLETVPTDINSLRLAYTQHKEKIAQLEAEIESLKAKKAQTSKAKAKDEPKAE